MIAWRADTPPARRAEHTDARTRVHTPARRGGIQVPGRIERAAAGLGLNPHMLRHACGFALANAGRDTRAVQAYLGHRNTQHTVRYTELASDRFKNFWTD
jgi:site-specific recombinase XerD